MDDQMDDHVEGTGHRPASVGGAAGPWLIAALFALQGCGAAQVVVPQDIQAGDAAGEGRCDPAALAGEAMTFVVDWQDGQRAALEAAMARGVVAVRARCEGVTVLPACQIGGGYAYGGATLRRKQV